MPAYVLVKNPEKNYELLLWNSKAPLEKLFQKEFYGPSGSDSLSFLHKASSVNSNMSWDEVEKFLPTSEFELFLHDNGCWNHVQRIADEVHVFPVKNFHMMSMLNELFNDEDVREECSTNPSMLYPNFDALIKDVFEVDTNSTAHTTAHIIEALEWYRFQDFSVLEQTRCFCEVNTVEFMRWVQVNPEIDAVITKAVLSEHVGEQASSAKQRKM